MPTKIDLKKEYKELYAAKKDPFMVDVQAFNYLALDGKGDPNKAQEYVEAIEALYPVAYALKFMLKNGPEALDYTVMPLEGQWWAEDMENFRTTSKDEWIWTMAIMQPEAITEDHFSRAVEQVRKKKNPASLNKLRFQSFRDGLSAQMLHIGPYSEEGPTIDRLHRFIEDEGCDLSGKHREIYLSDPRRTAPEKLKTIIRQPCRKRN